MSQIEAIIFTPRKKTKMRQTTQTSCRFEHIHHSPLKQADHHHAHDHDHHNHHHGSSIDKKLLKISFLITFVVMLVEIAGGIYANSLALISDAIHMFTHSFALGLSLFAITIALREPNEAKSFGYFRAEIIAALMNGLTIALSVVWILYEAILRFLNPEVILSQTTFIVALVGLVVNIITGVLLFRADQNNINIRSAFLHMIADTFSSVAIIIGAVVIHFTHMYVIDTILAIVVAAVVSKWSYALIKDAIHVLLEGSPVDTNIVKAQLLKEFTDIIDIHDIHCWEISHNCYYFTAHIVVAHCDYESYERMIYEISEYLEHHFNIGHTTLQFEKNV